MLRISGSRISPLTSIQRWVPFVALLWIATINGFFKIIQRSAQYNVFQNRYSRHEKPILGAPLPSKAGSPEGATVPRTCARCRHQLICELQLLPSFTRTLQLPSDKPTLAHLHFLSVLVFSCSQSCWELSDVFVNETVVFQPEI